jgi:hypothetical protein
MNKLLDDLELLIDEVIGKLEESFFGDSLNLDNYIKQIVGGMPVIIHMVDIKYRIMETHFDTGLSIDFFEIQRFEMINAKYNYMKKLYAKSKYFKSR